jgi:hypothetical protein
MPQEAEARSPGEVVQLPTRSTARPKAVTASASRLTGRKESALAKRLAQPWQYRCLTYYDEVPEINFSGDFYAKMLSRVRMFPAELNDEEELTEIQGGSPVDLLNRIQDPGGKRSRLQFDYGRLMFVTGEGILFVGNAEPEQWRFLWRDEVRILDNGVAERLNFQREVVEQGTAYRMWTPSPRQSDMATSPMRAVQDIAEELIGLTQTVMTTITSRKINGILAIASELSPDPLTPGTDEDPRANATFEAMIDHFTAQVENYGTPEAASPFIWEAPYDYMKNGEGIQWIKLHDPATDYMERDLRIEAVHRLALGLDFPPEYLEGSSGVNHWNGLQIQQQMWTLHGAPMAEQMCHDFGEAYLRPALRDDGYDGWERVVVGYDDSQVVVNPDRSADANNAADRGMISDDGYRELTGIPDALAPSQEEKDRYLAIKLRDPALIEGAGVTPVNERGPAQPAAVTNGTPGVPPVPSTGRVVSRQEAMTAAVSGAAQLALLRCRSQAGAKLRQVAARNKKACPECAVDLDGVPNAVVASVMGDERMAAINRADHAALVQGGTGEFADLLTAWGVGSEDAKGLCSRLEMYAAKTLLDATQPDLPPGFVAQVDQAFESMEVAA